MKPCSTALASSSATASRSTRSPVTPYSLRRDSQERSRLGIQYDPAQRGHRRAVSQAPWWPGGTDETVPNFRRDYPLFSADHLRASCFKIMPSSSGLIIFFSSGSKRETRNREGIERDSLG